MIRISPAERERNSLISTSCTTFSCRVSRAISSGGINDFNRLKLGSISVRPAGNSNFDLTRASLTAAEEKPQPTSTILRGR